mgnify:CR=1 FL=1
MSLILKSFSSLYFASLLMLLGSGLLSTYLGLHRKSAGQEQYYYDLRVSHLPILTQGLRKKCSV